jgi:hypothetical protein
MTRVDQFESVFRSASKEVYRPTAVQLHQVQVITDLDDSGARVFTAGLKGFLSTLGPEVSWTTPPADQVRDVDALLQLVKQQSPDLICTYRNLFSDSWQYPYSLGEHVDVLTQIAPCPVLVMPHPKSESSSANGLGNTQQVLAMGGNLSGDHSLVDWALHITAPGGHLRIAHIEDDATAARYMEAISKIASIDTDDAAETIVAQLLKEPREYIESVARAVALEKIDVRIDSEIRLGHRLGEYQRLIAEHAVDLLVMHTKDEDQMAMHGLAYPLAVELRSTPLLLL